MISGHVRREMFMALNDGIFNAFATNLTYRVRDRAKGIDERSERIINTRPEEFILAGFLTPRSRSQDNSNPDDDESADDLPQDSAYEQTAIGLEWMVVAAGFAAETSIEVEIGGYVYVRMLPTFEQ